jgi:hypothetical protein
MAKIAGSGSISQRHGSADPDPPQNVMDPQHRQGDAQAARAQPQDGRLYPSSRACSRRRSQVTLKQGCGSGSVSGSGVDPDAGGQK